MASIEKFIRAAQNPEKSAPKTTPAEKPTGATGPKLGRAGKAIVKPTAQTPFDKLAGEKASGGYDGRNVLLDVSNMSAVYLNTTASLARVALRCSDRDPAGRRIISADIFAVVSGTGLMLPYTNTQGATSTPEYGRAVVCQAEHGLVTASQQPPAVSRSAATGQPLISLPLQTMQAAAIAELMSRYAALDPALPSFVYGMTYPLDAVAFSIPTNALRMLSSRVTYIEEADRWHFGAWEWSAAAVIN